MGFNGKLKKCGAFFVVFMLSCGFTLVDDGPVNEKDGRIHLYGYSILAPKDNNWRLVKNHPRKLLFLKMMSGRTYDVDFISMENNYHFKSSDSFFNKMRKSIKESVYRDEDKSKNKYLDIKFWHKNIQKAWCIKYYKKMREYVDYNVTNNEYVIREFKGYYCLHPKNYKILVSLKGSVRYPRGERSTFSKSMEEFIESVRFEDFNEVINK